MRTRTAIERCTLWLCADAAALDARSLIERCSTAFDRAARAGLATRRIALWLRSASMLDGRAARALARALRALSDEHRGSLVIGERPDLAVLCGADAVHVTHAGPSARECDALLARLGAERMMLSAAVHDPYEARTHAEQCAMLVASPFDSVPGKSPPLGAAGLSAIVSAAPGRAIIALGGIDDSDAVHRTKAAGASGVAVRRALLDPSSRALSAVVDGLVAHIA